MHIKHLQIGTLAYTNANVLDANIYLPWNRLTADTENGTFPGREKVDRTRLKGVWWIMYLIKKSRCHGTWWRWLASTICCCKYVLEVLPGRFTNFSVCIAFLLHQFQMDLSNIDYLKVKVLFLSTLQIYVSNHNNTLAFSSSGLLATFIIAVLFWWQTQQRSLLGLVTLMWGSRDNQCLQNVL